MATTTLDDLPPELLQRVAEYLDRPSALLLRRVSRACQTAATPRVLRSIDLHLNSRRYLKGDVTSFENRLNCTNALKHVRLLRIAGDFQEDDLYHVGPISRNEWRCSRSEGVDGLRGKWHVHEAMIDGKPISYTYDDDSAWYPLAQLVEKFTGLRNLIFDTPHQLPPCLLRVLHTRLPRCKLHILRFGLRSLLHDTIDAHEYELATSTQLSSVGVACEIFYEDGHDDFNDLAILDLVSGLAPALKEVHLGYFVRPSRLTSGGSRGRWRGLYPNPTRYRGVLDSLHLDGDEKGHGNPVTPHGLARCNSAIDFSKLRQLSIEDAEDAAIHWLRVNGHFNSLTTLKFGGHEGFNTSYEEFSMLLRVLPPLQELQVDDGFSVSNLLALCSQQKNSGSLRHLQLLSRAKDDPIFLSNQQIERLVECCPNIESAGLCVQRYMGDREEVDIYHLLGRLPRLHTLEFNLGCGMVFGPGSSAEAQAGENGTPQLVMPVEEWFEDFEAEMFLPEKGYGPDDVRLRKGHIMKRLINTAVDETLAMAIWKTICAGKLPGSVPLRSLRLSQNTLGEYWYNKMLGIRETLNDLGIPWNIETSIRDDISDPIATLPRDDRCWHDRSRPRKTDPNLAPIMERIWPGIVDQGDHWNEYWSSRPLWTSVPVINRIPWA